MALTQLSRCCHPPGTRPALQVGVVMWGWRLQGVLCQWGVVQRNAKGLRACVCARLTQCSTVATTSSHTQHCARVPVGRAAVAQSLRKSLR